MIILSESPPLNELNMFFNIKITSLVLCYDCICCTDGTNHIYYIINMVSL